MENEPIKKCDWCDKIIPEKNHTYQTHDNEIICQSCYENESFCCEACGDIFPDDNRYYCDNCENSFCERCWQGQQCEHCEQSYCYDCMQDHNCNDSEEDENERLPIRHFRKSRHTGTTQADGNIITSARTFGIEIECYYNTIDNVFEIAENKNFALLGIEKDGSLGNNGIEFQTPPLAKQKGERFIIKLCEKLNILSYIVNTSCGLHIHIDGKDIYKQAEKIKKLWLFYLIFDDVLLAMLPKSRRENSYCLPLKKNYHHKKILDAYDIKQLEKLWYDLENYPEIEKIKKEKWNNTRYNGINLHSLFRDDMHTVEIRYHSGTINADKILYWVKLHQTIMDKICEVKTTTFLLLPFINILTLTEKIKTMFNFLELPAETQDYFWKRIKKFTPSISEENELMPFIIPNLQSEKICVE